MDLGKKVERAQAPGGLYGWEKPGLRERLDAAREAAKPLVTKPAFSRGSFPMAEKGDLDMIKRDGVTLEEDGRSLPFGFESWKDYYTWAEIVL